MHYGKGLISVFQEFFASIGKIFNLAGGLGTGHSILWDLGTLLIFSNFLRSKVLSRSATREDILIYHVYK